jgi:aminoglycoside 6'-N-acetyltransferase I
MPSDSPLTSRRPPHPLALALIERLHARTGAAILETGAGSGRNTRALEAAGFTVVSPENAASHGCAGALSSHALLHGTPSTIARDLESIARALEPGAPFYATFGSVHDARFGQGQEREPGVYAALSGDEAGVAHTFFDRARLETLLAARFIVEALDERDVDRIAGSWAHERAPLAGAVHWFALARLGASGGVRALRRDDVPSWLAMRRELWPQAEAGELAAEADAIVAVERDERAFVYENDAGELDGMLELSLRSVADGCSGSPVPFVEGWYVRPQSRRRGIGRALIEAAIRWARAHGFDELASAQFHMPLISGQ